MPLCARRQRISGHLIKPSAWPLPSYDPGMFMVALHQLDEAANHWSAAISVVVDNKVIEG